MQNVAELLFALLLIGILCWIHSRTLAARAPLGHRPQSFRGKLEAELRAETLLREVLSAPEYQQLSRQGYIDIPSPSLHRRFYRVPRYRGQVKVYEDGRPIMGLCVQPVEPMPDGDVVLMHKLMIEGNEQEYLRIANHFEAGTIFSYR